jgi:hypothetical protein
MTAFLDLNALRANALPADLASALLNVDRSRPRLSAEWVIAADGALICRWRIDEAGPADAELCASCARD